VHDRAEERSRLVVQVVAGGHDRHPLVERDAIHQVALAQATPRAGRTPRHLLDDRHRRADLVGHPPDEQRHAAAGGERLALGA
jgi:hypothetical protein